MSRAGDEAKELRCRVEEIDDLRYEEEQHSLAKVAQNGNHCKRHPCEVAEGVSYKHTGRVPEEKET